VAKAATQAGFLGCNNGSGWLGQGHGEWFLMTHEAESADLGEAEKPDFRKWHSRQFVSGANMAEGQIFDVFSAAGQP
jgi:hypothetical protein